MKYHYSSLRVYQTADILASLVYKYSNRFPQHELYGITSQLRRATLSIVLNIVEGSGRRMSSTKEFIHFLKIALGSFFETEYLLKFSFHQGYLKKNEFEEISSVHQKCGAELWKLIKSLENAR